MDASPILAFANELADIARGVALQYFRKTTAFDRKSDRSPVTIADKAIEAALRAEIARRRPEDGVLGEEEGLTNPGPKMWVIDPIDGTLSFMTGTPSFGTLIGYAEDGLPVAGVIEIPAAGERWTGERGEARMNGVPARVSGCERLSDARASTAGIDYFEPRDWERYDRMSRRAAIRRFGGECQQYGLLASGFFDVVADGSMMPHDFMAIVPVVEGAGGVITDWRGEPLTIASQGTVLATSSRRLHDEVLGALNT